MKLKTILGFLIGIFSVMILSATVNATPHFEVGKAIDLTSPNMDGATEIESFEAGKVIAVPINLYVDNDSDVVDFFSITLGYDDTCLKPYAFDEYDETVDENIIENFYAISGDPYSNSSLTGLGEKICAINTFVNANGRRYLGTTTYTNDTSLHFVTVNNSSLASMIYNNRVAYVLFEVTSNIEELNKAIMTRYPNGSSNYASSISVNSTRVPIDMYGTLENANACAGAFKVTIDGSQVPAGTWIREVCAYQSGGGDKITLSPVSIGEADSIYEFPVRVNIGADSELTSTDKVTYTIYASVSDTKDGESKDFLTTLGNVEVSLDGTVQSYSDTTLNSNQDYVN